MAKAVTACPVAPAQALVAAPVVPMALLDWCLLIALLVGTPLLYLPIVLHNLPVASHVDERNALEVLQRFHHGSLNPRFFEYPTLHFYLVYVLTLPLRYSNTHALVAGRIFDFALIGLTAFVVYMFCRDRLQSRTAGFVGACFVVGSTVLSDVAGYLHPDLLMTAAGMASLYCLVGYFEHRTLRSWLMGFALMGIAIGCKYTAFILYIAYFLAEALHSVYGRTPHLPDSGAGSRFSRRTCIVISLTASVILLLSSLFFPTRHLLAFIVKTRSTLEVRPSIYYLDFFRHIRRALAELGILCAALAFSCHMWRALYGAISIKRLYYGLGILLAILLLCTPFSVVHPKQFFFDLGKLARSNIVGVHGHAQWGTYTSWLMRGEGPITVVVGAIGIAVLAAKAGRRMTLVLVYLAMYLCVLGSSQVGYFRYLAPVIPLFYCGAGFVIVRLWGFRVQTAQSIAGWNPGRVLALLILVGVSIQMTYKFKQSRRSAYTTNSYFRSYVVAKQATTGTAYYAGDVPAIELREAGIKTQQLSWMSVSSGPLGRHLACGDTMLLSKPDVANYSVDAPLDKSVTILVNANGPQDVQQLVIRKSNCP